MAQKTWSTLSGTTTDYGTAGNWIEGSAPVATNDVIIGPSSSAIALSLNQSAVELNSFWVQEGAPAIGTLYEYLQIDVANGNILRFAGSGTAYLDLGAAAIAPQVDGTATPSAGYRGLYLKGSAFTALYCNGGHTGLAWQRNETSTATTIRVSGANTTFWGGPGVTNTTYQQSNGDNVIHFGNTTINLAGGTLYTRGSGTYTTVNAVKGTFYPCSSGTITTLNIWPGATVDFRGCGVPRTVTTINYYGGALWLDSFVTVTNPIVYPNGAVQLIAL